MWGGGYCKVSTTPSYISRPDGVKADEHTYDREIQLLLFLGFFLFLVATSANAEEARHDRLVHLLGAQPLPARR